MVLVGTGVSNVHQSSSLLGLRQRLQVLLVTDTEVEVFADCLPVRFHIWLVGKWPHPAACCSLGGCQRSLDTIVPVRHAHACTLSLAVPHALVSTSALH